MTQCATDRPPARPLLFDIEGIDFEAVAFDIEEIRRINRQRGAAEQIDYICWHSQDLRQGIGIRRVRDDEWWCDGHVPGEPVLPAVMMVEAAAQVASFLFQKRLTNDYEFLGFARIENTKFRRIVRPGDTLAILCSEVKFHPRRFICDAQGLADGQIAFETRVTGMPIL